MRRICLECDRWFNNDDPKECLCPDCLAENLEAIAILEAKEKEIQLNSVSDLIYLGFPVYRKVN